MGVDRFDLFQRGESTRQFFCNAKYAMQSYYQGNKSIPWHVYVKILHGEKVTEPFLGRSFIRRSRYHRHEDKMGTRKWLTDDMKKYLKR